MTANRQAQKLEHAGKGLFGVGAYLYAPSAQSVPVRQCEEADVRPNATALCCRLARRADITRKWDAVKKTKDQLQIRLQKTVSIKTRKGTGVSKRLRALRSGCTGTSTTTQKKLCRSSSTDRLRFSEY